MSRRHRTLRRLRAVVTGIGLPLLAVFAPMGVSAQQAPPAMEVGVDAVRMVRVEDTFPVLGRFVSLESGAVAAAVAGPVEAVLVKVGDRVRKGGLLARLASESPKARRNLLKAELAERRAARTTALRLLELASGELDRLRMLRGSSAFPKAQYDDKINDVKRFRSQVGEAESAIARAEANLQIAEIDLDRVEIRAPYDGIVVDRAVAAGAYLSVGEPVVAMVNNRNMEIEAEVPSNRLAGLTAGRRVLAVPEGAEAIETMLRAVLPAEDVATRTRLVRLVPVDGLVPHGGQEFAADQTVTVMVPAAAARDVLSVHKDAVIQGPQGPSVVVVLDGKAEYRPVRLGDPAGDRFMVLWGLKENDITVIRGNERLRPGQPVRHKPLPAHSGAGGRSGG